jgi:hypothetical protein
MLNPPQVSSTAHADTRQTPATSTNIPVRIMCPIGTLPVPYTTAFGGVDTGSMAPNPDAKATAMTRTTGDVPAGADAKAIGTMIEDAAVFLLPARPLQKRSDTIQ